MYIDVLIKIIIRDTLKNSIINVQTLKNIDIFDTIQIPCCVQHDLYYTGYIYVCTYTHILYMYIMNFPYKNFNKN